MPHPAQPYRDDPSDSEEETLIASPAPRRHHSTSPDRRNHSTHSSHSSQATVTGFVIPYTDVVPENDDDVPLAYLYPYPTEAPPSYQVAVRESYRATLIQHIPRASVVSYTDEEQGVDRPEADDVRFSVERVVATIIVAMILLLIAGLLALGALGYFAMGAL